MDPEFLTCPFCGFEFEKEDTLCHHGCPLGANCRFSRCPNCAYEFAEKPRAVSWLERIFRRPAKADTSLPEQVVSVSDLAGGERATVLCIGGGTEHRKNGLAVFGLVPGAEVQLVQHKPSCVLRVGETELALDGEIAREIQVERLVPGMPANVHPQVDQSDQNS